MHFSHFPKEIMSVHVWRQTQTQSTINNFYEEDMNILNPRRNDRGNGDGILRMEFPLMQWLVAATYKVFGNHLILSRIFMFIVGIFSVFGMYQLLANIFQNKDIALIGAWAFNFSPCFYYYTINPMPDNFALCCSIWGVALFFSWYRNNKLHLLLLSGLLLSIGALCKLPFILYFIVPLSWFLMELIKKGIHKDLILKASANSVFIILPLVWYFSVISAWDGNGIVGGIFDTEIPISTILYYFQDNLISTLPEMLLNYGSVLFFILGFYFIVKNKSYNNPLFVIMAIWSFAILAYFIYEINMIATVHDYYLFPFFPILFILVAYGAFNMLKLQKKSAKYLVYFLLLILPLTAYLRMEVRWDPASPGFNADLLIYKKELRSAVPKNALCVAGNDISHYIFFYYIDKKGWAFDNDLINAQSLKEMINKGAQYLYSDSRNIDTNKDISPFLDKLILERGSIRVYSLRDIN